MFSYQIASNGSFPHKTLFCGPNLKHSVALKRASTTSPSRHQPPTRLSQVEAITLGQRKPSPKLPCRATVNKSSRWGTKAFRRTSLDIVFVRVGKLPGAAFNLTSDNLVARPSADFYARQGTLNCAKEAFCIDAPPNCPPLVTVSWLTLN